MATRRGTAIVTGVSSEIGLAVAERLASDGYRIFGTYRTKTDGLVQLRSHVDGLGGEVHLEQAMAEDGGIAHAVGEATERLGDVAVLVNNVGHPICRVPFVESTDDIWDEAYLVNLRQAVQATRVVLQRSMIPAGHGCVVNVSSIAARTGTPGLGVHYAAFKSALNTFTLGVGKEVASHGIRVNAVAPGTIDTRLHASSPEGHLERMAQRIPMGRVGAPAEIAELVRFLASDEAGYITGEVIYATGGL